MQRFYFKNLENTDDTITVKNPDLLNQFLKVLRVKVGEKFIFFNGNENIDYIFELKSIEKREAFLVKNGFIKKENKLEKNINIVQSIPNKIDKIEFILQKGVEVGVSSFLFFKAERSQRLNLTENKLNRLEKIVIEAVEQSDRNDIPEISFLEDIFLDDFKNGENIIFHTDSGKSIILKNLKLDFSKNINLFIGPEGGFSNTEIDLFEKKGFKKICLGKNILRTETVGIVSCFYLFQS